MNLKQQPHGGGKRYALIAGQGQHLDRAAQHERGAVPGGQRLPGSLTRTPPSTPSPAPPVQVPKAMSSLA